MLLKWHNRSWLSAGSTKNFFNYTFKEFAHIHNLETEEFYNYSGMRLPNETALENGTHFTMSCKHMFFAHYWQPCLAYTEFLWVACFVRPIFSSQSRFALIFYVMRLHRLNKYKNGCKRTTINLQLIIVNYIQVWPI
jgi:hypothetical protein